MTGGIELLGLEHPAMARRLANLLIARRTQTGQRRVFLARASRGRWTRQNLIDIEAGRVALDPSAIVEIAHLYGANLGLILPRRLPLTIDADSLGTAGVTTFYRPGDRASLLSGYLMLVRKLRQNPMSPTLELRRSDIEVIACHLGDSPAAVVDELGLMLGANPRQRKALAALLTTGVGVVTLSVLSIATARTAAGRGEEATVMSFRRTPEMSDEVDDDLDATAVSATSSPIIVLTAPSVTVAQRETGDGGPPRLADAGHVAPADRRMAPPSPLPAFDGWDESKSGGSVALAVKSAPAATVEMASDDEFDASVWSIESFEDSMLPWGPPVAADRVEVGTPPVPM